MKIWREKDSPSHPFAEDISILRKAIESQEAKSDLVRCTRPGDYSPVKHQDLSGGRHDRIKTPSIPDSWKFCSADRRPRYDRGEESRCFFDRRAPVDPFTYPLKFPGRSKILMT